MNTPAHLLLGAAVFSRKSDPKRTTASIVGAILPDLSLYLLAGTSLYVLGISPNRVFNELYFSDTWQTIFAIDNSLILWGLLFALGFWRSWGVATALAGAALLHIATDLPLHHDDGRPHFWPFTDWVYESPLSYWDSSQNAALVAPFTGALVLISAIVLWRRFPNFAGRIAILVLVGLELWTIRQWILFF